MHRLSPPRPSTRVVRIIQLYEFEDGSWDALDNRLDLPVRVADHTLSADAPRVTNTDRDGVYDFVNDRLYPRKEPS